MTKEKIEKELEKARSAGNKSYEESLLRSYENTYGEKWQANTTKKSSKQNGQSKKA